eukprot:TRINITY_DN9004_c0_g1_i1.p1 TRINITY_DN9004_c0_g1~~TRINITY_DN9004_c0_g1_i1.p1  ORF type:complete len:349 (-),score=84.17 TRINITY_DN9004_c0_g1_i1:24-956(-)
MALETTLRAINLKSPQISTPGRNRQWGGYSTLTFTNMQEADPFLFMVHHSHFFKKGTKDEGFPGHPHRGFETVTYAIEGGMQHGDTTGNRGVYGSGDVQWMTAGRGVLHSEMWHNSDEHDTTHNLFQIWVNLPSRLKLCDPEYLMLWNKDIPIFQSQDQNQPSSNSSINSECVGDVWIKVIGGRINGVESSVKKSTPLSIFHVKMQPGSRWRFATPIDHSAIMYSFEGNAEITTRSSSQRLETFQTALFEKDGDGIEVSNPNQTPLQFMFLEGKPFKEPIAARGPFVMNTQQELQQAWIDLRNGEFGTLD